MKQKVTICLLLILIVLGFAMICVGCNKEVVDRARYKYDYAYVLLPTGEVIEGKVESWNDFPNETTDEVQVTIEGKTYFTHSVNIVLVKY